ncbi:MAG: hypothetical protein ACRD2O_04535 [Terriglobia bacterium]
MNDSHGECFSRRELSPGKANIHYRRRLSWKTPTAQNLYLGRHSFPATSAAVPENQTHFETGCAHAALLAKARAAYQDFFVLWKNADPDIPILTQAKAEYTRLQSSRSCAVWRWARPALSLLL